MNRTRIAGLLLAGAALGAAPAWAQEEINQDITVLPGRSRAAVSGVIQGVVERLNLTQGLVTVSIGNRNLTLHGTPSQIASLNPGDVGSFPYNNYQGQLWLDESIGDTGMASAGGFQNSGVLTGTVAQMGRTRGTITIRGNTFRVHPNELQGVAPGQFVSLTFSDVGGVPWAWQVAPAGEATVP